MSNSISIIAEIEGGKLPSFVSARIREALSGLDGKLVEIDIREKGKRRSIPQNKYYWGVVIPAIQRMFLDAGNNYNADEVHDFLKIHIGKLGKNFVLPDGEVKRGLGDTKSMNTEEFEQYLEKCRVFAAEHGCEIPLPNEGVSY